MIEISTSVLSVPQENATRIFYDLEVAKTDYFHIDVMDGEFVENDTIQQMREYANIIHHISNIPLDIHFMVKDIEKYLYDYIDLKPNRITIHYESNKNSEAILGLLQTIKENGSKVGISVKPNTPIQEITEFLPYVHSLLVMTVEPGKGGQPLIPEMIKKVEQLKQYMVQKQIDLDIEVDGGVNTENAGKLIQAGANILVAGSAIISATSYKDAIQKLRQGEE